MKSNVFTRKKVAAALALLCSRCLCHRTEDQICLTVIDEFTRACHAIDVSGSIRSARVIDLLTRSISAHRVPAFLRSDNGHGFVSKAILERLADAKIDTALIDPAKPWQ